MSTQDPRDWMGIANSIGNFLGQGVSLQQGLEYANQVSELGAEAAQRITDAGAAAAEQSKFDPYGVTTTLGTSSIGYDANGNLNVDLGVGQNPYYQNQATTYGDAGANMMANAMQDPYARQQQIYNEMMAMQNPMLDQAQAQQQAREYAMGRGGIRGSAFGGTAEDAAMARARTQASQQASINAIEMGMAEQAQQAKIAEAFGRVGMDYEKISYLPMNMQLEVLKQAGTDADRQQTGDLTSASQSLQSEMAAVNSWLNSENISSQTRAKIFQALASNLGGSNGNPGMLGDIVGGIYELVTGG